MRTEVAWCANMPSRWLPRWRRMSKNRTDLSQKSRAYSLKAVGAILLIWPDNSSSLFKAVGASSPTRRDNSSTTLGGVRVTRESEVVTASTIASSFYLQTGLRKVGARARSSHVYVKS